MCLTSCKSYPCQTILLKAMLKFEILSMLFLSMFLLLHLLLFALHYEICRTYASMSCLFCIHLNLCMDSIMMFAYVPYLAYLLGVRTCILLLLVTSSFSIVFSTLHTSIPNLIDNVALPPTCILVIEHYPYILFALVPRVLSLQTEYRESSVVMVLSPPPVPHVQRKCCSTIVFHMKNIDHISKPCELRTKSIILS